MKKIAVLIMTLMLVLGMGSVASAAETGTWLPDSTIGNVCVLVTDSDGNVMPNETLTITLSGYVNYDVITDVVTNGDGVFRFDAPAGKYTIEIDATNYSKVATMTLPIADYIEISTDTISGKLVVNEFSINASSDYRFIQIIVSK